MRLAVLATSNDSGIVRRTTDGGMNWNTIASIYLPNQAYDFEGILISPIHSTVGSQLIKVGFIIRLMVVFLGYFVEGAARWSSPLTEFVPRRDIQFTTLNNGWAVGGFERVKHW
ncbi:MAG: hypothetical protein MZV64_21560 [Ignavibacteriales bacterium]|nr:hypothetical protein [Ignavibacteriales bacterium]